MPTPLETLVALTADLQEEALDQLVHDLKTREASSLNNEGFEGQITYLIEALGADKAAEEIKFLLTLAPAKGDA